MWYIVHREVRVLRAGLVPLVLVLLLAGSVAHADPLPVYITVSEYQTAPDSLERIELHYFPPAPIYENVYGWRIVTSAGTSWVSDSVWLDSSSYVVIDSSNTSGIFSLGDEEDYISILDWQPLLPEGISYPDESPAPPEGASVALFFMWCEDEYGARFDYYIDSVPTFGGENLHYPGCAASGYVRSGEDSLPIAGATLHFLCSDPPLFVCPDVSLKTDVVVSTDSAGAYWVDSLYALSYEVLVRADGFGSEQSVLELRGALHTTHADFYLVQTRIEAERETTSRNSLGISPNPFRQEVCIWTPAGAGNVSIWDASGRRLIQLPTGFVKWDGRDGCGRELPAGAYFLQYSAGQRSQAEKLVKVR